MIYPDVKFGTFPKNAVCINPAELSARVGAGMNYSSEQLSENIENLKKVLSFRYAYVSLPVSICGNVCDFGFTTCESKNLSDLLKGCNKAFFLAVTAGIGVDRLISSTEPLTKSGAFFIDAASSAAVESFCDLINEKICRGLEVTKRFSPGYGDVPLCFQKPLLQRLNSPSSVGITLNSSLLMTPMKSITAIIGIKNSKEENPYEKN